MEDVIKQYLTPGKKNVLLIYITYLSVLIMPFAPIIGAYFAYKNMQHKDTFLRSHYTLALRTFLISAAILLGVLVVTVIGLGITFIFNLEMLAFIGGIVAMLIYYILFMWIILRSIIAIKLLVEDKAHPNPLTFWIN